MLEGGKISGRQAVYLIIITILPTSILFLPHLVYIGARHDAWLSIILITAFGLAAGDIIGRLGRKFPGQTVVEYSRTLLGTVPGFVIGAIYAGHFIYINAIIVREFGELLITNFIPETPVAVIIISIVLAAVYIVRHGLEVMARVNDMVLPLVFLMVLAVLLLSIPNVRTENLLPVLENGLLPVFSGTVPAGVFFAETYVMLMLIPYLNKPPEARRVIARGILTMGLLQLLVMLTAISVLGAQLNNLLFPTLNLARQIRLEHFLTNVDPLILLVWILGGFMKISVFHYCATLATSQLLGLRSYGAVAVINGVILGILSVILWEDALELAYHIANVIPFYFLPIQVGLPLLLLVFATITGKGAPNK